MIPDPVVILQDGQYVFASQAFTDIFGYTQEDIQNGLSFYELVQDANRDAVRQRYEDRLAGKPVSKTYAIDLVARDGSIVPCETSAVAIEHDGRSADLVTLRDITERRETERALRDSEERWRSVVQSAPGYVLTVDREGTILFLNRAMEGMTVESVVGKCAYDFAQPERRQILEGIVERVFTTGGTISFEGLGPGPGDTPNWYAVRMSPIRSGDDVAAAVMIATDITERKEAEETLRRSEERFRNVYSTAPLAFVIWDRECRVTDWNSRAEELFGWSRGEVLGKNFFEFLIPEGARPGVENVVEALLRGELPSRSGNENLTKGGSTIVCDWSNSILRDADGNITGAMSLALDITERVRAEKALRDSEERYRAITESAEDCIFCKDAARRYTFVNRAAQRLLGRPAEELVGRTPEEVFGERDAAVVRDVDDRNFAGETVDAVRTLRIGDRNVTLHTIQVPLRDAEGNVEGIAGIVRDVTEQTRAAEALRESEERFRTLFEESNDGIFILDMAGNVMDVNRHAYETLGYTREQMLSMHVAQFVAPDLMYSVPANIKVVKREGKAIFESAHTRSDGTVVPVEVNANVMNLKGEERFLCLVRDITERKQAEEEARRSERLEALGLLAGGIAHDFNNMLMGVMASVSSARLDPHTSVDAAQALNDAEKAIVRARGLTQQLLTFSRGGAPVRRAASIADLVRDTAEFALAGSSIRCRFEFPRGLWPAHVDENQISQVIQNLVLNAKHAMPEGGFVDVDASNVRVEAGEVPPLKPGKYVCISIRDQGAGIAREDLTRIFDPYFTTKATDSGLGLAISHSIVQKHEGHIRVDSRPGVGTCVEIFLPAGEAEAVPAAEAGGKAGKGEGHILLMDDDAIIRRGARNLLTQLGYDVACAADGEEALRLYADAASDGSPFDAVVLDLTVPAGMGGTTCLDRLKQFDPSVRAVVSSGYADDPIMADYRAHGFLAVVRKPYTAEELVRALDQAMGRGGTA
jgi:PAS domain S-box-containing protein